MKKLLMFLVLLCISIGMQAQDPTWTDGTSSVTITNHEFAGSATYQKIVVNQAGALAAFISATKDESTPLLGLGSESGRVNLQIVGTLNAADLAALNSSTATPLGTFTSLDLKNAQIEITTNDETGAQTSGISGIKMSNLKYLRLPSNFNTIESMSGLSTTDNPNLEVALSTDALGYNANKIVINSFKANGLNGARSVFIDSENNGYSGFSELSKVKFVTMSGMFGDKDLRDYDNNVNIFGNSPAVWDFTGANFEPITVSTPGTFSTMAPYYANDDPFAEGAKNYPAANYPYTTNAFYYFSYYAQNAVKINLPTEITDLPDACLMGFGNNGQNSGNYALAYPDADVSETNYVIEELVIPNNITRIGFDCASGCKVRKIVIGNGNGEDMTICGGAFGNSNDIEEVDFVPGLSNCVIGHSAFNEGQTSQMKHITLPEGVTSLGVDCFNNSQHLESIRLPESLQYIGNGCFYDCHALSSITIPENVEKIGKTAFSLTALKDVYLTTTDPTKIPEIFTAGTGWTDNDCTFGINEEYGNNSVPGSDPGYSGMTWDEITDYMFANSNRIASLHFPKQLAEKVRASICDQYDFTSQDGFKIPSQSNVAANVQNLRGNIPGALIADPNNPTLGTYSTDGWAQFVLMKEYDPDTETEVFEKLYDDVWYTMCFPFDLTDEQLASAFTEDFNIVDFSAVEIRPATETEKKTLVLHFNKVAETLYKDTEGNKYARKTDSNGEVVRVEDGSYSYNVYYKMNSDGTVDESAEYRHVQVGESGGTYKTKTFAKNGDKTNGVLIIDGYLALAGHPYMIHPNTGAKAGSPKVRCHFSGITWKEKDANGGYEQLYNDNARTVDLGVEKTTDNFNQVAYDGYAGQQYKFIGSWKPEQPVKPIQPTEVANPGTMEDPSLNPVDEPTYTFPENPGDNPPTAPTAPTAPTVPTEVSAPTETVEPWSGDVPQNPDVWPRNEYFKYFTGWETATYDSWGQYNGFSSEEEFNTRKSEYLTEKAAWNTYNDYMTRYNEYIQALNDYNQYLSDLENYNNVLYPQYLLDKDFFDSTTWPNYEADLADYTSKKEIYDNYMETVYNTPEEIAKREAYANYLVSLQNYQTYLKRLAQYNKYLEDLAAYQEALTEYNQIKDNPSLYNLIPKNAYFLGRKKNSDGTYAELPKYYRETAPDNVHRTTGLWSQYSAIIMPNAAALEGIEAGVDPNVQGGVKGYNIAFNEDYEGEFDVTEIKHIVAKAEEKGQKVEYMNIVYSINGEIVGHGSSSLNNLPKGMYIINGKKYLVK